MTQSINAEDERVPLIRGLCGGFLFAIPIIYTMEVWYLGYTMPLARVAGFFALGYVLAVGLNYFSGFRDNKRWSVVCSDAAVTLAVGVLVSAVMLLLVGVITLVTSWAVALSHVAILAVPVSIGVALSRTQLGAGDDVEGEANVWVDIGTTLMGALFTGLSVAPTEELMAIAEQGSLLHLLATVTLSLTLSYAMVFLAGFAGGSGAQRSASPLHSPLGETLLSYVLSLAVAGALLGFLGYFQGTPSPFHVLTMVVVLGLPTTLGGAAGRLIL